MPVRCVLFDLFGTLLEYDAARTSQNYSQTYDFVCGLGYGEPYEKFLSKTEQAFAELDLWSVNAQREYSMLQLAENLLNDLGLARGVLSDREYQQFADLYTADWSSGIGAVPGVQALLSRAAKRFTLGLITNTHYEPMVHRLLEQFELKGFSIVTASVTHGRPKPHVEIFSDTLSQLGLEAAEAVYVGDNYQADYLGATRAGMQCYLIGRNARVPREYRVPSVIDLPLHLIR